jgi:hypothetical protein
MKKLYKKFLLFLENRREKKHENLIKNQYKLSNWAQRERYKRKLRTRGYNDDFINQFLNG